MHCEPNTPVSQGNLPGSKRLALLSELPKRSNEQLLTLRRIHSDLTTDAGYACSALRCRSPREIPTHCTHPMLHRFRNEFLVGKGLDVIMLLLYSDMATYPTQEAELYAECVACVAQYMNSRAGFADIVNNERCLRVLAQAMAKAGPGVLYSILNIFSMVALSPTGHHKVLAAFTALANASKDQAPRFGYLVGIITDPYRRAREDLQVCYPLRLFILFRSCPSLIHSSTDSRS